MHHKTTYNTNTGVCDVNANNGCNDTTKYETNGFCCPLNYYYNIKNEKCERLLDPLCERSNDINSCTVCTDSNNVSNVGEYVIELVLEVTESGNRKSLTDY